MNFLKISAICAFLSLFVFACTQSETTSNNSNSRNSANSKAEKTATPDEFAVGRKNYKEQCAVCHQDDGTGGKVTVEGKTLKVEDLTSDKMIGEPDEEYIEYMVKGIPDEGMPSFKDILSDEEMKEVVKYIRSEIQKQGDK